MLYRANKMAPKAPFYGVFGDKVYPTSQVLFFRQLVQMRRRLGRRRLACT